MGQAFRARVWLWLGNREDLIKLGYREDLVRLAYTNAVFGGQE